MKYATLLFFFLLTTLIPAQNKKIQGHWTAVSKGDSLLTLEELFRPGGTITFERIKKYNDQLYQWGGGCYMGIEFGERGAFAFYQNTLCSTESSPVTHTEETWEITDAQTITIKGPGKNYRARIIYISKNKLTLTFQ